MSWHVKVTVPLCRISLSSLLLHGSRESNSRLHLCMASTLLATEPSCWPFMLSIDSENTVQILEDIVSNQKRG